MKYEWEEKDVIPGRVIRNYLIKDILNKAIITVNTHNLYSLVSLVDGYCMAPLLSKEAIVKVLNDCKYEPTDDDYETTRAIDYLRGVR